MEATADWRSLPDELLALVLDKLSLLPDYLHFGAVCKSWNNAARSELDRWTTSHPQLPMLLVPLRDGSEEKRGLYDVINHKNSEYKVSVPYNWRCCGSSHGWLFFSSKTHLFMLNPFTNKSPHKLPPMIWPKRKRKKLPPMNNLKLSKDEDESYYIHNVFKAVLSCDPSLYPNDYQVAVICTEFNKLAIFRAGDKDWTAIKGKPKPPYLDVIHHRGNFYVLNQKMGLGWINVACNKIEMVVPQFPPWNGPEYVARFGDGSRFPHLVESSRGQLICTLRVMVDKEDEEPTGQLVTSSFKLFKLEKVPGSDQSMMWVDTDTLGGDTVFVGENHSLAINSEKMVGIPPNCIYFTDNMGCLITLYHPFGPRDMGVFNIETCSLGPSFNIDCLRIPPLWIVPTLN